MSARDTQVGGDHYRNMAIQPIDFIQQNGLDFIQGCIVKYACRYPHKGQAIDDLRKIKHYAELAIEQLNVAKPPTPATSTEVSQQWPAPLRDDMGGCSACDE